MTFKTADVSGIPVFNNVSEHDTIILILQPLFEEANRVRRTLVQMCRALDLAGFGVAVPDLPGMGENAAFVSDVTFGSMQDAVTALASSYRADNKRLVSAGFRAGCLFDGAASVDGAWRFAPETGDRLVRTMMRTEADEGSTEQCAFVQGQPVSRALLAELSAAELEDVSPLRTIRLASDRTPADFHIEASPLWRHAEPGEDPVLAKFLAEDIVKWAKSCASS